MPVRCLNQCDFCIHKCCDDCIRQTIRAGRDWWWCPHCSDNVFQNVCLDVESALPFAPDREVAEFSDGPEDLFCDLEHEYQQYQMQECEERVLPPVRVLDEA